MSDPVLTEPEHFRLPEYYLHQAALGRDISEYRPEIRQKQAAVNAERRIRQASAAERRHAARAYRDLLDGSQGGFGAQRLPRWRRLVLRLRGWDA